MPLSSPILTADRGRASATAWGVLCLLAFVQGGLVVRAIAHRHAMESEPPASTPGIVAAPPVGLAPPGGSGAGLGEPDHPATAPGVMEPPAPGVLAPSAGAPRQSSAPAPSSAPPPVGSFELPGAPGASRPGAGAMSQPPPTAGLHRPAPEPSSTASLPPSQPDTAAPLRTATGSSAPPGNAGAGTGAENMTAKELVDLAKQVRGLGDMQGALEVLKRADLQFPEHPAVMAEMAQSYEQMGLGDKATALWKRLQTMDPAKAAGFDDLATRRLSATAASGANAFAAMTLHGEGLKVLTLGACQAARDPATVNGEKVILRIPILRHGMGTIDPNQVDIDVFFFDRVNGEKVAQTIANEPLSTWSAPPVDWSGAGEEPLEVAYFMPALTPGEIQNHGRRSYHGYVVRLYYQHKLQDVAAEPRDLLEFGSRAPQSAGAANPLLPPVTN